MKLPEGVRREVEAGWGPIREVRPVGGGCINPAARLQLEDRAVFLKFNPGAPAGMFAVEAEGLRALEAAGSGLRVPEVLGMRDAGPGRGGDEGWLLLEWLEPAPPAAGHGERLGRGLAALHRATAEGWGWHRDGFIGPLPQPNAPLPDWPRFWAERRLEPQLRLAREAGRQPGSAAEWDRLLTALPELLAAGRQDGPSLLHGDLWGGNVLAVAGGEPALVDPAAYRGHREVDLAMAELFGGFDRSFLAAYREAWPLRPGYAEVRRGVYQLFYLLVHVNLFGGGYGEQTAQVLRAVLASA